MRPNFTVGLVLLGIITALSGLTAMWLHVDASEMRMPPASAPRHKGRGPRLIRVRQRGVELGA